MPAGARVYIEIPEALRDLHDAATSTAKQRGDVLAEYVHDAILTATAAAEAGHGELLPRKPAVAPRQRRQSGEERKGGGSIRYKAAVGERDRCWAAIYGAGSTPALVAAAALRAYVHVRGVRMDVELPWVPRFRRRGSSDGASPVGAVRAAGAA